MEVYRPNRTESNRQTHIYDYHATMVDPKMTTQSSLRNRVQMFEKPELSGQGAGDRPPGRNDMPTSPSSTTSSPKRVLALNGSISRRYHDIRARRSLSPRRRYGGAAVSNESGSPRKESRLDDDQQFFRSATDGGGNGRISAQSGREPVLRPEVTATWDVDTRQDRELVRDTSPSRSIMSGLERTIGVEEGAGWFSPDEHSSDSSSNHQPATKSPSRAPSKEEMNFPVRGAAAAESKMARLRSIRSRSPALVRLNRSRELKTNLNAASVIMQEEKASSVGSGSSSAKSSLSNKELEDVAKRALRMSKEPSRTYSAPRSKMIRSSPLHQMMMEKRAKKNAQLDPSHNNNSTGIARSWDNHSHAVGSFRSPFHHTASTAEETEDSHGGRARAQQYHQRQQQPSLTKRLSRAERYMSINRRPPPPEDETPNEAPSQKDGPRIVHPVFGYSRKYVPVPKQAVSAESADSSSTISSDPPVIVDRFHPVAPVGPSTTIEPEKRSRTDRLSAISGYRNYRRFGQNDGYVEVEEPEASHDGPKLKSITEVGDGAKTASRNSDAFGTGISSPNRHRVVEGLSPRNHSSWSITPPPPPPASPKKFHVSLGSPRNQALPTRAEKIRISLGSPRKREPVGQHSAGSSRKDEDIQDVRYEPVGEHWSSESESSEENRSTTEALGEANLSFNSSDSSDVDVASENDSTGYSSQNNSSLVQFSAAFPSPEDVEEKEPLSHLSSTDASASFTQQHILAGVKSETRRVDPSSRADELSYREFQSVDNQKSRWENSIGQNRSDENPKQARSNSMTKKMSTKSKGQQRSGLDKKDDEDDDIFSGLEEESDRKASRTREVSENKTPPTQDVQDLVSGEQDFPMVASSSGEFSSNSSSSEKLGSPHASPPPPHCRTTDQVPKPVLLNDDEDNELNDDEDNEDMNLDNSNELSVRSDLTSSLIAGKGARKKWFGNKVETIREGDDDDDDDDEISEEEYHARMKHSEKKRRKQRPARHSRDDLLDDSAIVDSFAISKATNNNNDQYDASAFLGLGCALLESIYSACRLQSKLTCAVVDYIV